MPYPEGERTELRERELVVEELPVHAVESGDPDAPTILFLHGWPECWAAFGRIMEILGSDYHVVAIDLPGIGGSTVAPRSGDKRTLARLVRGVGRALRTHELTLVGHDAGGMIVYAYLRAFPDDLRSAVIMNVAIPGVDPWSEVVANQAIWHFAFHAVPRLPELLVQGHEAEYFGYFFDAIAARPEAVSAEARRIHTDAYRRPEALRAGFDWYRAFRRDAEDNARDTGRSLRTPVLYLRGELEQGLPLKRYVEGLRASGLTATEGRTVPASGHFAPEEQPAAVAELLQEFLTSLPAPYGAFDNPGRGPQCSA